MIATLIQNYVSGTNSYTIMKYTDNLFRVECRQNGVLVRDIPFITETEAKFFAESNIGSSGAQLLNESN
jgi:hypothetical protein